MTEPTAAMDTRLGLHGQRRSCSRFNPFGWVWLARLTCVHCRRAWRLR